MVNFKQSSTKLPILLALPVLALLGVAAVFLLGPDDPDPPKPPGPQPELNEPETPPGNDGEDPLKVDPSTIKRPTPKPGAPESIDVAEAMYAEAFEHMRAVRARLELKYKYADYQLDRAWTLETVMRHLEKLDGEYFQRGDFRLSFPEGDEPEVLIECVTQKGAELPDGTLSLAVNLRTGKSAEQGVLYARNRQGGVLLNADDTWRVRNLLQRCAIAHILAQLKHEGEGVAPTDDLINSTWEHFEHDDFSITTRGQAVAFACRSIMGEPLAEPCVIDVDYARKRVSLSSMPSNPWPPGPESAESLQDSAEWYLRSIAESASALVKKEGHGEEVSLDELEVSPWYFTQMGVCPFDLTIRVKKGERVTVTLEIRSSWGRPLRCKYVRLIACPDQDDYRFESG
ncbi:MAG: hypothetical protein KDB82_18585 [Planctomycetes bacterium]|nr:hypothetical protein [Planctomycetota bacterium]